jgi:HD-GYP domain-containing protein (c-di-GMP phosphodiesterase class II)
MKERIGAFLGDFLSAVQSSKLYGLEHPIFKSALDKAYKSISNLLIERDDLIIGIIAEEVVFDKEIIPASSSLSKGAVNYLKAQGVERIVFNRGVRLFELKKLIVLLSAAKEESLEKLKEGLLLAGVDNIDIGKIGKEVKARAVKEEPFKDIVSPLIKILNRQSFDGGILKSSIINIIKNLDSQYQQLVKLNTLKRYDSTTFVHLVNTSILSMFFASKLGFTKEAILEIGISALFHDIGKLYISRSIIRKTGQLSESEFSLMESHTTLGSTLILRYVDTVGIMPAIVSFEHHLKYDLSGYPKLFFPRRPHIISQLVSICDVYDALAQRRSYKSDYPPDVIYNIMMRGRGTTFNPELLDKFFNIVGVWPIGAIVGLSDNRVGVVCRINEGEPFLPKVRIIAPEEEGEIDLKDKGAGIKIERYLNPFKEGKDYLTLI